MVFLNRTVYSHREIGNITTLRCEKVRCEQLRGRKAKGEKNAAAFSDGTARIAASPSTHHPACAGPGGGGCYAYVTAPVSQGHTDTGPVHS